MKIVPLRNQKKKNRLDLDNFGGSEQLGKAALDLSQAVFTLNSFSQEVTL